MTILAKYAKDEFTASIIEGHNKDERFKVNDGLILYKERIFLASGSKMKEKILTAMHDAPLARHPRLLKTYKAVRERFAWRGIKEDVYKHVKECVKCQENKTKNVFPPNSLQTLSIPK